ncbi:hypothetical protein [Loktanella sp. M215]|uniref:hypothetical protein n=1 Tax=Loktanella sp. M215 TaxID=2675431 RepID=UPI001F319C3A|nr:hypothetical protein [Loktanella sp. M215]MCF7699978.1 hypothetical protein [Loktanella sp. M215]
MKMKVSSSNARIINSDAHSYFPAFDWEALKSILDNKIVASTNIWVFVLPAIMVLTEKFPVSLQIFPFGAQAPLELSLKIPYNWFLLYFAAMAFFCARLIYVIRCPNFLRQYRSAADAVNNGVTAEILRERVKEFLVDYQKKKLHILSDEYEKITRLIELILPENAKPAIIMKLGQFADFGGVSMENSIHEVAGEGTYYVDVSDSDGVNRFGYSPNRQITSLLIFRLLDLQNISRRSGRMAASILVSAGFLLVAVPILQGFCAVLLNFLQI